jgi:cytosine/adenosine deaminase-related metal-dependent hydrolase
MTEWNAAKLLDLSDEVGTIASGKSADVIAADSSPLDDVSVLQRVAFVMAPNFSARTVNLPLRSKPPARRCGC